MKEKDFSMKAGWQWFVEGWHLFKKSPVIWLIAAAVWIVLEAGLALLPYAGWLIDGLLFPFLYGGFLAAAQESDQGGKVPIKSFFRGFQRSKIIPLGTLSLIMVAYAAFSELLVFELGPLPAAWMVAPLFILVFAALLYSVPLVLFTDTKPVAAVKSSYKRCGENISAMITIVLAFMVFGVLSAVTFGLALVVIMPVTFGAFYISYKNIFAEA